LKGNPLKRLPDETKGLIVMKDLFRPGNVLKVKSLDYNHKASKMLVDMGITPNTMIYVDKTAPFGEPVVISVRNYKLALRKRDLMALKVEQHV
jgi:Fe2+ transport system protein FeoA